MAIIEKLKNSVYPAIKIRNILVVNSSASGGFAPTPPPGVCLCLATPLVLMCCNLAQLNILCSSVIKPYFTKIATCPLFTVHMLRPLHAFSNILDLIEATEQSIHPNVQYFIWSEKSVFHFTTVRYSLHKCSERIL